MGLSDIAVQVEGVWLPKGEKHLLEWMTKSKGAVRRDGKITYQWSKQQFAMDLAERFIPDLKKRTFVDVGAHVGLWSMWWAPLCGQVVAFEPIPQMREIYSANMAGVSHILSPFALGDVGGSVTLSFNPENTGNTHRYRDDGGSDGVSIEAPLAPLDVVYPGLSHLKMGVLKIDCEGSEEAVVVGALNTIKQERPLIVVEQKKGAEYYGASPTGAVDRLLGIGYRTVHTLSGDYFMVHEGLL